MDPLTRLLLDARDGDRLALSTVIRHTQPEVWRFCAHLTSIDDADDVTQDVYLRAFRSLPRFRGDASARTWLLAIARNACADRVRALQRRRGHVAFGVEPPEVAFTDGRSAEVDDLLRCVEADRRAAFVLTQLLGLSYAEAADACEVPIGTIRSRVARAREDLLVLLEAADGSTRTA